MDIDTALEHLRAAPLDHGLDQLEPGVWARLAECEPPEPLWGLRATAFAILLTFGLISGARLPNANAAEMAPFSAHASLAPSTLLEGGQ